MPLYKPSGVFSGEITDPEKLEQEFRKAKNIAENTTSWQWMSSKKSGLEYNTMAENGAGVIVHQKQRAAHLRIGGSSHLNVDARNINRESLKLSEPLDPWYIPYMRGWHDVWGGELNIDWTSSHSELVLISYSFFAYRLASKEESVYTDSSGQYWFDVKVQPRIKFGVSVDGSIVEGSGCGTNNVTSSPETVYGNGSRQKAIVSSSSSVQMLGAGAHLVSPVAGQGPANARDRLNYYKTDEILTAPGEGLNGPNHGVVMVNARLNIFRFPRGRRFGV